MTADTQASFTPEEMRTLRSIIDHISSIERNVEVPTTDQIGTSVDGLGLFAHDPHGDSEHNQAYADDPHGNSEHSTPFADNPHNNSEHSATYATTSELTTAITGHDSEHDDRFSQLGHNHSALYSVLSHTHTFVGTYTGDGTSGAGGRQITTATLLKAVIILGGTSTGTLEVFVSLSTGFCARFDNGGNVTYNTGCHLHASDGFVVGDGTATGANTNTKSYIALMFT